MPKLTFDYQIDSVENNEIRIFNLKEKCVALFLFQFFLYYLAADSLHSVLALR
jgi:hypothetical protein